MLMVELTSEKKKELQLLIKALANAVLEDYKPRDSAKREFKSVEKITYLSDKKSETTSASFEFKVIVKKSFFKLLSKEETIFHAEVYIYYNDKQDVSGIKIIYLVVNEKQKEDVYPADLSKDYSRKALLKEIRTRIPSANIDESFKGVIFFEE